MTEEGFDPMHPARGDCSEEPANTSASPFRRSISIFSRRGTETPEPLPNFITQAAMRLPCPRSRPMSERQKSWMGRRKSVGKGCGKSKNAASKLPRATVLHAVPPSNTIEMTSLEEKMATCPNEDTLSAISERAPALRTRSQRRRDTSSRIGVWIDGVVQWDQKALDDYLSPKAGDIEHAGFTLVRPVSSARPLSPQNSPLSVVIPSHALLVDDRSASTIVQPKPMRPIVSAPPASIVSTFPAAAPTIVLGDVRGTPSPPEQLSAATSTHKSHASVSSTSTSSRAITDEGSVHSRRSSATSVSLFSNSEKQCRLFAPKSTLLRPTSASVFEEAPSKKINMNKSLPPTPTPTPPVRAAASPPPAVSSRPCNSLRVPGSEKLQPAQPLRQSRSMSQLDQCDEEFMRSCITRRHAHSPTLTQAEQDVRAQLSAMEEQVQDRTLPQNAGESTVCGSLDRRDSVRDVMQPPARAPTIPRRSRKRDWRSSKQQTRATMDFSMADIPSRRRSESHVKSTQPPVQKEDVTLRKVSSVSHHDKRPQNLLVLPQLQTGDDTLADLDADDQVEDVSENPSPIFDENAVPTVPSGSAEEVLLGILSNLASTDDLFNTAIINKGMYRVYKENEMFLLRSVMANQSPAAWETREWTPPDRNELSSTKRSSQLEYDPLSYMRCFKRDLRVIERLKRLILENCQTLVRRETTFALSTPSHPNAQRFNDSFWRIWCFCEIFGCRKGREEDITGQLDWLKGGLLANNQGFSATVNTNLDFEMSSVLLNAPDHFARANAGGLSASQLFDMTEIWTCFAVLLQGYYGRVIQARKYGIFDSCDIVEGDTEAEEATLEEWISYLLTLGPSVVLDMALLASDTTPAGFAHAKQQGWTEWTPPEYNGSRSNFLKEPVARSYEEQVAAAKLRLRDPLEQEQKEMSRKRVASMAAEIRLRRQSSDYRRLPFIDMKNERAMSTASRHSTISSCSRSSDMTFRTAVSKTSSRPRRASASPASSTTCANSAKSLWQAPRLISPIIETRVESFDRTSLINYAQGQAEDTGEIAVQRIVAMGFPPNQAREALRQTDMGDGLRVDRAVELLLRQA